MFQVKLIFILCITIIVQAQSNILQNGCKIYSVKPDTIDKVEQLKKWNNELDFFEGIHLNQPVRVMVLAEVVGSFQQQLQEHQIENRVLLDNVEDFVKSERNEMISKVMARKKRSTITSTAEFTFDHYWTYEDISLYLSLLSNTYANMTTLKTIGHSSELREIQALEISFSNKPNKSMIYVDSGMVAREWAGPMTVLYLIHELVVNWRANLDILEDVDWVIVPLLNPDGFAYSQNVHRFWAKTRATVPGSECRGVHLNRNFASDWMATGSSDDPCSVNFAGVDENSEPEANAVDLLLNVHYPDRIKIFASVHAYGSQILYPFSRSGIEQSSNQRDLQLLAQSYTTTIRGNSGRAFSMGQAAQQSGEASGTSTDYAHDTLAIPYVYKILLPEGGEFGFDFPERQLSSLCNEFFYGFVVFGRFIRNNFPSMQQD